MDAWVANRQYNIQYNVYNICYPAANLRHDGSRIKKTVLPGECLAGRSIYSVSD